MCWVTQTDGEIMESMTVLDYSWEGHGLQKGDVITSIQGVPVHKQYAIVPHQASPGHPPHQSYDHTERPAGGAGQRRFSACDVCSLDWQGWWTMGTILERQAPNTLLPSPRNG